MTKFFISFFILTFLIAAYPQPGDSIFVIISDDTVHIWNTGAHENCGCLFRIDVMLSNDSIYVTEVDTASDWAFCTCYFDLCESVTGLQSGDYLVKIFRYMPLFYPDTVFYIGSTSFIYGGSMLGFSSQSFQSDCYNITQVIGGGERPKEFVLKQNYPNPFNPSATFRYSIPNESKVIIKVYDILGKEIETLVNEEKPAGTYELTWYAEQLPSGVYFYQLKATPSGRQAGNFVQTKKMILLK
jgi:hypothetical protein